MWVNSVSRHFIGAPFGGYQQSGIGRKERMDELLGYTQVEDIMLELR